jgi:GNAT superfamily N-acetyltransferase
MTKKNRIINLEPLIEDETSEACRLISQAMNLDEGRWAEETMRFHFSCRAHGIEDGRHYFTFREKGGLLAMIGLHHDLWGPEQNVWLAWFAAHPDFQRRGLGTSLLEAIEAEALKKGFTKMFVETYGKSDFEKARNFYRSHGFEKVGEINNYLADNHSMVVFMKHLAK